MTRTRPVVPSCLMALLLILASEPGQAVAAPDPLLSLIPRDGEVEGFVRDGAPILCYDEESLAEHIDGAAPFYLERGAVAVLFQYYLRQASGEDLKIEIYRMKDRTSARHLFEEIERGRPASDDPAIKGLGEGRHLEQALQGVYLLEFYAGAFFIRMEAQGKGPQTKEALLHFGSSVSASVRGLAKRAP